MKEQYIKKTDNTVNDNLFIGCIAVFLNNKNHNNNTTLPGSTLTKFLPYNLSSLYMAENSVDHGQLNGEAGGMKNSLK